MYMPFVKKKGDNVLYYSGNKMSVKIALVECDNLPTDGIVTSTYAIRI